MRTGFTFIEIILYIALLTTIITTIGGVYSGMVAQYTADTGIRAVEEDGRFAMALMLQRIRNAESVGNIAPGESAASLTLELADNSLSPTTFDLSQKTLRISEDNGSPQPVTGDLVEVSGLTFENRAVDTAHDTIRVKLTVQAVPQPGTNNARYSRTFRGSAQTRDSY